MITRGRRPRPAVAAVIRIGAKRSLAPRTTILRPNVSPSYLSRCWQWWMRRMTFRAAIPNTARNPTRHLPIDRRPDMWVPPRDREGRVGRGELQEVRRGGVRQERHGTGPPALPVQGLRLQLHRHAGARQTRGHEGLGGPALRHGQRQPGHDRQAPGRQPRHRLQVSARGRRDPAGARGRAVERGRADRRDVALREREKNKVWLWRAFDPVARRTLAWELGGRDDATCRRLLDKVGLAGRIFLTDDWEGFHRLIPAEQLFTGKDLTFPIEQDNSNIRHYLARFRRRSKVTSRARHMVDSSLRLLHHLMRPENFLLHRDQFLSIFA